MKRNDRTRPPLLLSAALLCAPWGCLESSQDAQDPYLGADGDEGTGPDPDPAAEPLGQKQAPGCIAPSFSTANANVWWKEFSTAEAYESVAFEVAGDATYAMQVQYGKWALGGLNTPAGTQVRLHAMTADGQSGQTDWFAYLDEEPSGIDCPTCAGDTSYDASTDADHDLGANVGDGWSLWSNGGLQLSHDFAGEAGLTVRARGELYGDQPPRMRVSVGGTVVGTRDVSSASMSSYAFDVAGFEGTQAIEVEFINDAYDGPENDRNLVVAEVLLTCAGGGDEPMGGGPAQDIVDAHGQLSIEGRYVVDECGRVTQLRGMSYFWHQWDGSANFWNDDVLAWLRDDWKVQIVRGAVGVHPSGWFADPSGSEAAARQLIEAAIEQGVYVVVDWHSHDIHLEEAKGFFGRIAQDYGDHPNVIYEIFNEPDGSSWTDLDETWPEIKSYSREVIAEIRQHDPDNIIIVGTPFYDQFVDLAADDPLTTDADGAPVSNIAYTLHVYAGAHRQAVRDRAQYAVDEGLPLFVTESGRTGTSWGPSNSLDPASWETWEAWFDDNSISWMRWSLSTKNEVSSSLQPSASTSGGWSAADLRSEGTWNRNHFRAVNTIPSRCPG